MAYPDRTIYDDHVAKIVTSLSLARR
jgi:hypothetical protein